jgi:hypothetical protein
LHAQSDITPDNIVAGECLNHQSFLTWAWLESWSCILINRIDYNFMWRNVCGANTYICGISDLLFGREGLCLQFDILLAVKIVVFFLWVITPCVLVGSISYIDSAVLLPHRGSLYKVWGSHGAEGVDICLLSSNAIGIVRSTYDFIFLCLGLNQ